MTEEQVIDVVAEEVTEQPEPEINSDPIDLSNVQPRNPYDEYVSYKKTEYKMKQLRKQVRNNMKAKRGFGYNYQEIVVPEQI